MIKEAEKLADTTMKTGFSGFLQKIKPEKKPKEPKMSRKEKRERFKKRLECLTPEEQRYLKRKRVTDAVWPVFRAVIVFGLCFIILYPLLFMISSAFRTSADMNDPTVMWIPKHLTMNNLKDVVKAMNFGSTFTEVLTEITSDILNLVWKCGIQIIIFLSALQGIPSSAKEAAAIEGATAWEFFWKITLPYISSMILVNIVYTVIDAFIDPTNKVMERLLSVQSEWKYGYSAAMAWSYFGIILIALGIIFWIMNKLVWYDD